MLWLIPCLGQDHAYLAIGTRWSCWPGYTNLLKENSPSQTTRCEIKDSSCGFVQQVSTIRNQWYCTHTHLMTFRLVSLYMNVIAFPQSLRWCSRPLWFRIVNHWGRVRMTYIEGKTIIRIIISINTKTMVQTHIFLRLASSACVLSYSFFSHTPP